MPPNREPALRQPLLPALARADRRRLVEQTVFFLLLGQPGEFGHELVPGRKERFLAGEDGGIGARRVVVAVELPRPERELDAAEQARMRVGVEIGIDQVRDLPRMPVQLDQVRPLDLAKIRAGAVLVHAEQRLERIERLAVNIEGIRQELSDRGPLAGLIDRLGVPLAEQQVVGLTVGLGVAAKESPVGSPKSKGIQLRERIEIHRTGPASKSFVPRHHSTVKSLNV